MSVDVSRDMSRDMNIDMSNSTSRCLGCRSFNLEEVPELARHGFGWCWHCNIDLGNGLRSRAVTVSAARACCNQFGAASEPVVRQRIVWLAQQCARKVQIRKGR